MGFGSPALTLFHIVQLSRAVGDLLGLIVEQEDVTPFWEGKDRVFNIGFHKTKSGPGICRMNPNRSFYLLVVLSREGIKLIPDGDGEPMCEMDEPRPWKAAILDELACVMRKDEMHDYADMLLPAYFRMSMIPTPSNIDVE